MANHPNRSNVSGETIRLTIRQRIVLEAGRADAYAYGEHLTPPIHYWQLADHTRPTSTVNRLIELGLMERDESGAAPVARITNAGRAALSGS